MQRRSNNQLTVTPPRFALSQWLEAGAFRFPALLLSSFVFAFAVISRRPDAFLNPQFFAEDGNVWFAEAYNFGWLRALFITHTGYFQTLPRLGAALALAVPLAHAPLVMNLIGLAVQIAPAVYLLSARTSNWAPLRIRFLMAAAYLAVPNTSELNVSITEAQWHLALLASLVVLSRAPESRLAITFDLAVLALCGLTGPFCIVLFPSAQIMYWKHPNRWRRIVTALLGSAALLQGISLLSSAVRTRASMPLGASLDLLCRILVSQVFLGPLFGMNSALRRGDLYVYSLTALGIGLLAYCCVRARLEWALFILFSALIFTGSMFTPQASYDQPQWVALARAWGTRYWFFPILAFVWCLLWYAGVGQNRALRFFGGAALIIMCAHIPKEWRLKPCADLHFASQVRNRFDPAPAGTVVSLPILPGDQWDVKLKKK